MLCSALVGRRPELDTMSRVLVGGSGGVVAVVGEAGIGKSRLVRELCSSARGGDVVVVSGRAVQSRRPSPYRPPLTRSFAPPIGLEPITAIAG